MNGHEIEQIHKHSSNHRAEIEASRQCGCFCCRKIFPATDIVDYVDGGETALCPNCDTDAVIGDASGHTLTPELLEEMNRVYFDFDDLSEGK